MPDEAVRLGAADGQRTIGRIIDHPDLGQHSLAGRTAFAQRVFRRWWELGHLSLAKPAAAAAAS